MRDQVLDTKFAAFAAHYGYVHDFYGRAIALTQSPYLDDRIIENNKVTGFWASAIGRDDKEYEVRYHLKDDLNDEVEAEDMCTWKDYTLYSRGKVLLEFNCVSA